MARAFCEWGERRVPGQPSIALSTFPALQTVSQQQSPCVLNDTGHVIMNDGSCCFRPEKIEIGKVMSLQQVKQKIPSALFSWSLYTGSHEGLSTNLKACALIALQSPSSGQPIYHQSRYYQPIFAIF